MAPWPRAPAKEGGSEAGKDSAIASSTGSRRAVSRASGRDAGAGAGTREGAGGSTSVTSFTSQTRRTSHHRPAVIASPKAIFQPMRTLWLELHRTSPRCLPAGTGPKPDALRGVTGVPASILRRHRCPRRDLTHVVDQLLPLASESLQGEAPEGEGPRLLSHFLGRLGTGKEQGHSLDEFLDIGR